MDWWQRTHRIADVPLPVWSDEKHRAWAAVPRELVFDVQHVAPLELRGGQRGVFYFKTRAAEGSHPDHLGAYLEAARGAGIRVVITLDVHWLESGFASRHRDWLQTRADGVLIDDVHGKGAAACPNSPGFRAWSLQLIRDLARYPVDGIRLEGPAFRSYACWCASCAARFQERQGKPLPARENWEDAAWKEFVDFRYDSVAEYVQQARAALKKTRGDAVFYTSGPVAAAGWTTGRDDRRLAQHQDLLCGQAPEAAAPGMLWSHTLAARLLETRAAGRPAQVVVPHRDRRWVHASVGAQETRLAYAEVIANAGSPVYHAPDWDADRQAGESAAVMNTFLKRYTKYFEGTQSTADVALLWSDRTADYYHALVSVTEHGPTGEKHTRKQRSGDHARALQGWFDCLTRAHVQFDVADERTLEDGLDRYRVLILPNVACFSQKHASAITSWVHAGGVLLSTFETSCYTDWGVRRSTPALRDVLGVESTAVDGPTTYDYLDRARDPIFDDVSSPLVPSPRFRSMVTLCSEHARAVAWYRERMTTPHHPLPPVSKHPAIVANPYGAGSSLYFAGTIDETWLDHHHPDHAALMTARVNARTRAAPRIRAAACVQVVVRQQRSKRRLIVHLINATGEMVRPIGRVAALQRIRLELDGLKSLGAATYLVPGETGPRVLSPKPRRKGGWELALPELEDYCVVVLEGATLAS